ncbi:MAG: hypothetical protein ACOY93_02825 [Bacillota bacterium]
MQVSKKMGIVAIVAMMALGTILMGAGTGKDADVMVREQNLDAAGRIQVGIDWANQPASSGEVTVVNFPETQQVTGTVAVSNLPATQQVAGSVQVGNLPVAQTQEGPAVAVASVARLVPVGAPFGQPLGPMSHNAITDWMDPGETNLVKFYTEGYRYVHLWLNPSGSANSVKVFDSMAYTDFTAQSMELETYQAWGASRLKTYEVKGNELLIYLKNESADAMSFDIAAKGVR